jgi:Holliday junction resolvase-like predicted endonuclease
MTRLVGNMATVEELWQGAHDLYARARTSIDPSTKRMLMRAADDYLKQADDIRGGRTVIAADFPET